MAATESGRVIEARTGAPVAYGTAVRRILTGRQTALGEVLAGLTFEWEPLAEAVSLLVGTLRTGHKALVIGNGGSAAEAEHFAAELVGRFQLDRAPYAAIALCTDAAIMTAVSNDYGYEQVFARQVAGLGRPGDLLVAFSTSGESENVVRAAQTARDCGMAVLALTGAEESRLERLADQVVRVPATNTALVQEIHTVITHVLCEIAERELAVEESE